MGMLFVNWLILLYACVTQQGIMCQLYKTYEIQEPNVPISGPEFGLEGYDGGDYGGYGYGDYGINGYEYTLEKVEPEPVIFECFTCTYTKLKYHEHGMTNCDEPFKDDGVPVVQCDGLCAKTKSMLGKDEYMVTRSCLANCQTIYDDESSVECCYGDRCNGARNGVVASLRVANIIVVSVSMISLVLM